VNELYCLCTDCRDSSIAQEGTESHYGLASSRGTRVGAVATHALLARVWIRGTVRDAVSTRHF
jgi:hypothetical protein